MLGSKVKAWYVSLLEPITRTSLSFGIHPNVLTILGFAITVFSGVLFAMGAFLWAGVVLFIGGSCDVLDGHLARITDQKSVFGALLDSTLDRYAEIVVFVGIVAYFLYNAPPDPLNEIWVDFAFTGIALGLELYPCNTLADAIGLVLDDGTLKIKGDTGDNATSEIPTITKAMRIEAIGGAVRIGE